MGSFNTRITTDEYAMADTMVIDEGGIDLLLDGDQVIAASFEGLDPLKLMFDIMPEEERGGHSAEELEAHKKDVIAIREECTPEEQEEALKWAMNAVYSSLWNVAVLKGWSK